MTPPRRVLVVDDEDACLKVAEGFLRAAGMEFCGVREATRAVPEARAFKPHVILLDRVMPVLNGHEVARSLRAFPETAGIPVVFVTDDRSERELLHAVNSGAVDVIYKPFTAEHAQRVAELLDGLASRPPSPPLSLEEAAVRSLLGIYARDRCTGLLLLNPGTPFEGRAAFKAGELVSAEFGPLRWHQALKEMLATEDGIWLFDPDPDRPRPTPPPISRVAPAPLPSPDSRGESLSYRPRLLVVDDDDEMRRLFKAQLLRAGFDVVIAEDGVSGIELSKREPFDLVVADLNMPRLDGWGMLKELKANHRTRELPVVFLSAYDDYRETLRAARSGAADYLPKIGRSDSVVQRLLTILTPRLDALAEIDARREFGFQVALVGVQWLLRMLAHAQRTGTVTCEDDWAHYSVSLREGVPVDAHAQWPKREAKGVAAVAALIVSRSAEGRFAPGPVTAEDRIGLPMEDLLQRTSDTLNQLEARVMANRLNTAGRFVADEALYELYRRIAPEKGLRLAKAVCEEGLLPADLPQRLGIKPEEVQEGLKELLRRRVIRFAEGG